MIKQKFKHSFIYPIYLKLAYITGYRKKIIVLTPSDIDMLIEDWIKEFPDNIDCIIGIPRAGLVIADKMSLLLSCPLSTPDYFLKEIMWQSHSLPQPIFNEVKNVILVDDWTATGEQILGWYEILKVKYPKINIYLATLIGSRVHPEITFIYCTVTEYPRKMIMYSDLKKRSCQYNRKYLVEM